MFGNLAHASQSSHAVLKSKMSHLVEKLFGMYNASICPIVCKLCVKVCTKMVFRKATMVRVLGYNSSLVAHMKL